MYTQRIIAPYYLYIPKREHITEMFDCDLENSGIGKLYLTQNFICFNSTINHSLKLPLLMSDIDSIKIQKNKIILTTDVKCYKSSIFIFTFEDPNIKEIYQTIKNRIIFKNKIEMNFQKKLKNFSYYKKFSSKETNSSSELYSNEDEELNKENYSTEICFTEEFPTRLNKFSYRKEKPEKKQSKIKNDIDLDLKYFPIPFLDLSEIKDKFESKKMIVKNYSAEKLFQTFIFGTGDYTKDHLTQFNYYQTLDDHFDMSQDNWKYDEEKKEYIKTVNFKLKLSGVPFINESSVSSLQYYKPKKNTFIFKSISKSFGVPLCDCFNVVDIKEIYPLNDNSCVMKFIGYNEFVQNTFFKNVINQTSFKTFKKNERTWCNFLKNNGVIIEKYDEEKMEKLINEKQLNCNKFDDENRDSVNSKDSSTENSDEEKKIEETKEEAKEESKEKSNEETKEEIKEETKEEKKEENFLNKLSNFWNIQLKEAQKKVKEKMEKEKMNKKEKENN